MGPLYTPSLWTNAKTDPQALSAFAEYVEEQQSIRYPTRQNAPQATTDDAEHHEELDELFDNLDLDDAGPQIPLKTLLLGNDDDATLEKLQQLVAERVAEGCGEAVLEIGYENSGEPMQLTLDEWNKAYAQLEEAARLAGATCQLLITKNVGGDVKSSATVPTAGAAAGSAPSKDKDTGCSGKVLIRQLPSEIEEVIETRIAVVGNGMSQRSKYPSKDMLTMTVDAGKSSMLGVLVKGDLDDGRGKARVNLFRHKHEIESGRTSSVGMEIMGFDSTGKIVTSDVPGRECIWQGLLTHIF